MTDRLHEYKSLLVLGLPILAGQLGNIATGFADNIMLGHYDTDALAAASFCNNVFNLAILCSLGFAYGLTPTVSSLFARGAFSRIGNVMRNAVLFNVLYAVLIMAAMGVMYLNLHRLGQPETLLPLMRPYFVLCLVGLLPLALFNVMAQWSYGIGNTAMPMWIILGGNVINVVGNWALIYGNLGCSEMGLIGAGIATLTSRVLCAAVICLIFLLAKRYGVYSRAARAGRLERGTLAAIWRTSVPVSMQLTFETAAFSGAAIFVGMLGKIELAAFQIIVTVGMLGFCVYYAIGAAVTIRVARACGRRSAKQALRSAWCGYHILLVAMVAAAMIFGFGSKYIMALFTNDPKVLACALSVVVPLILYQTGDATQVTFANALRGTSKVTPMLWIALVSYIVVGLPSTYVIGIKLGYGLYGVVVSFSISLTLAAALYLLYFRRAVRRL